MRPSRETATQLHQRLLAGEPDATADLVEAFLDPLIAAMRVRFPRLADPNLVDSLVIDALLAFVKRPERYDPGQSSVWSYLAMVIARDLLNAVDQQRRRDRREVSLDQLEDVELAAAGRNGNIEQSTEEMVLRRLVPDGLPDTVAMDQVWNLVQEGFTDPEDRALLELMLAGVRKTESYAVVLGIPDLPEPEQRRRVKQAKDRIQIRLKRIGQKLHDKPGP